VKTVVDYELVQVTFPLGIAPFTVCELNVHETVRTKVPPVPLASAGWKTVIVALVNAMSVMISVQLEFGQSGAPSTGVWGGLS
jgi:hypothetical protein